MQGVLFKEFKKSDKLWKKWKSEEVYGIFQNKVGKNIRKYQRLQELFLALNFFKDYLKWIREHAKGVEAILNCFLVLVLF